MQTPETPSVTPTSTAGPLLPALSVDENVVLPSASASASASVIPTSMDASASPVHGLRMENVFDIIYVCTEKSTVSNDEKIHREITKYVNEEEVLSVSGKTLVSWEEHKVAYPLLSHLVLKYMCIPGTSVLSERVFSTAQGSTKMWGGGCP